MSKKRKATPQSSTLLDFFGNNASASSVRVSKKQRAKITLCKLATVKKENPENVIVIDSSDEDEVVEVTPIRPAPKPIQAVATRTPESTPADYMVENRNVKSELNFEQCDTSGAPSTSGNHGNCVSRDPSPSGSGYPGIIAAPPYTEIPIPPISGLPDCSHDGLASSLSPSAPREPNTTKEVFLGSGDWDMGDDEMELLDIDPQVKAEETQSVDIDLTLDDDVLQEGEDQPVEICPVCEKALAGLSSLEIHNHVDECLNSLPDNKGAVVAIPPPSTSNGKPLHPLLSLQTPNPSPSADAGPATSSPNVKREACNANVFSTLMTSYKENEAWKEASAVEDSNFRSTKANGGRRKTPFYKVMQGMPIAVDAFRYGTIPNVTAYFLTHAHSDHYTNLSAKWDNGPIYCSQGTANLIIHMLGVDPEWVHPLPMDVATTIPNTGGVQVTLIEANHCPGSCLFLFEGKQTINAGDSAYKSPHVGSAKMFRYLHCGDFRACPQHVLHPAIQGKRIDHVYLDTTYLDPKYCFPPQPLVISACAELAQRLVQGKSPEDVSAGEVKPRTMTGWFTRVEKSDKGKEKAHDKVLVVVGTYSIGKERIVKAIAKALGTKVYCDSRKAAILRCQSDPELHALLTTDPIAAGVHVVPLAVIASDRLKAYMERWKGHFTKAVGFRPTGWTYTPPKGTDTLPTIPTVISRSQSRTFTYANLQPMRNSTTALQVYGVPYSEHSSFFELTCFALSFDWDRMIATVNVGSEASRGKMAKWVQRWEAERKKRGEIEVVGYRTHEYW